MLKKESFNRNEVSVEAFSKLKEDMTSTPVFAVHDSTKTFVVECDTTGLGVGAVLIQERTIAFFSHPYKVNSSCYLLMREKFWLWYY